MTQPSVPCRWCGWRASYAFPDPAQTLREHEFTCPLGAPCDHCGAIPGERCHTVTGKPAPFHEARKATP